MSDPGAGRDVAPEVLSWALEPYTTEHWRPLPGNKRNPALVRPFGNTPLLSVRVGEGGGRPPMGNPGNRAQHYSAAQSVARG